MGGFLAKLSVSALMFDYILTGPTSGVSAGQYIMGLAVPVHQDHQSRCLWQAIGLDDDDWLKALKRLGAVIDRRAGHALFLPPEPARHPRIERQGAQDHDRHHDHGRHHACLVLVTLVVTAARSTTITWKPDLNKKVELDTRSSRTSPARIPRSDRTNAGKHHRDGQDRSAETRRRPASPSLAR